MTTSPQIPVPDFTYKPQRPKRVLWKWTVAIGAIGLLFLMWQCGSAFYFGSKLANDAVQRFHTELNSGKYNQICDEADEAFSQSDKRDELLHLLESVHRKLGNAGSEKQVNLTVNAMTSGTFVVAHFTTQFDQGQAEETFTWRKSAGSLKLYGYNVNSRVFLN
jgi:hypothetical protein